MPKQSTHQAGAARQPSENESRMDKLPNTFIIERPCSCGCDRMTIGQAWSVAKKRIYPFVCCDCGVVHTQYAKKVVALAEAQALGRELPEVLTDTQRRVDIYQAEVSVRDARRCQVCDSAAEVQRHHWAPFYLFGKESEQWPTSWLCQVCHTRWHQIVTPLMGQVSSL